MNSSRLAVTFGGSGRPAIFIHGFGSSKFTWRHICQGVDDIYSYFAIDLPGSGDSSAPDGFDYSLKNLSRVLSDFASERDLRNIALVAHSLGAGLAFLALLQEDSSFSSRVTSLCIVDGIFYPQHFPFYVGTLRLPFLSDLLLNLVSPRIQARSVLKYCYFNDSLITEEQVNQYSKYLRRREVREALKKTARMIDPKQLSSFTSLLKLIRIPVLLIWGREDKAVPLELGQRLQRELPSASIVVIDQCGHMPQEEQPGLVIKAIRTFEQTLNNLR